MSGVPLMSEPSPELKKILQPILTEITPLCQADSGMHDCNRIAYWIAYQRCTGMKVGEPWSTFQIPYGVKNWPPRMVR